MSNKLSWNAVKHFMTNKGILTDDKIAIESENDVKIKSEVINSVEKRISKWEML